MQNWGGVVSACACGGGQVVWFLPFFFPFLPCMIVCSYHLGSGSILAPLPCSLAKVGLSKYKKKKKKK